MASGAAIIGSLAAIIAIIAYAKVFARKSKVQDKETFTLAESLKAWSVYLFILIFILVSGRSSQKSSKDSNYYYLCIVFIPSNYARSTFNNSKMREMRR